MKARFSHLYVPQGLRTTRERALERLRCNGSLKPPHWPGEVHQTYDLKSTNATAIDRTI